jgi:hypothetical protein
MGQGKPGRDRRTTSPDGMTAADIADGQPRFEHQNDFVSDLVQASAIFE